MTKNISELFEDFKALKHWTKKKAFLEEHKDNTTLKFLLQGTFDPNIVWNINKIPKYTPDEGPDGVNPATLFNTIPKCSIFVKGHPRSKGVTEQRLSELLIQVLESMNENESALYVGMLKKKLKIKGLTEKLVLGVFPDLYKKD
tara:strand:+ start:69 stop:500 length:432 start_codon:yes stop_codon:yes gene_type:complete